MGWGGAGWGGGGGVSCFQGHLNKCPLGDLNKCPLGDLNKSPWENYLEGGGSEEIIKSTRFCKVHYVLNSDINYNMFLLIHSTFLILTRVVSKVKVWMAKWETNPLNFI